MGNNTLLRDSLWAYIGSCVGKLMALVAGILIARFLGKELYGEYGTVKNTLTYAAIVSSFGFGYSATKFIADYIINKKEKIRSLVKTVTMITVLLGVLLSLVVSIFSSPIAVFLESPHLEMPLRYLSVLVLFNSLTATQTAILSGFKKFKELAYVNVVTGAVTLVASAILTFYYGLYGAIVALLLAFIAQAIYSHVAIHNELKKYESDEKLTLSEVKSLLSFSTPIALQESLYTITSSCSLFLMIKYANYGEVGLNAAASTWESIVIFIPGVLKNVMFSYLSSSNNHQKLVTSLLRYNFFASLIPTLLFILCSRIIVSMYGDNFSALTPVLLVALVAAVVVSVSEVLCYEFISKGKPWTVFLARTCRDCLSLLGTYILLINVNSMQAFGAKTIGLVCQIIFFLLLLYYYHASNRERGIE